MNSLSAQYGTLFVIAAGNHQPGSPPNLTYIASPGAADAALTVGAVDSSDQLAAFSNVGPRLNNDALKPDITAPGVNVIAARAVNGTFPPLAGEPQYTELSGTSMATPLTAGAAAILKQEYPTWSHDRLKAALVNSAKPGPFTVYQQGGGRLDLASATTSTVLQQSGTADFGLIPWPQNQPPVSHQISLGNGGNAAATFNLTVQLNDPNGQPAPAGLITLSQTTVTVQPDGASSVGLTLTPHSGATIGGYSGYLTATQQGGSMVLHTPIGFFFEQQSYNLTMHVHDRNGQPTTGLVDISNMDNIRTYQNYASISDGQVLRLPAGHYSVLSILNDNVGMTLSMVGNPQVDLTSADATVSLDAAAADPITLSRPPTATLNGALMEYSAHPVGVGQSGNTFLLQIGNNPQSWGLFAQPMAAPSTGALDFDTRWQLSDGSTNYDLLFPEQSGIAANLQYTINPGSLATVTYPIDALRSGQQVMVGLFSDPFYTVFATSINFTTVTLPTVYTVKVSTSSVYWAADLFMATSGDSTQMLTPYLYYAAGQTSSHTLLQSPLRPSAEFPSYVIRNSDGTLEAALPQLVDSGGLELTGFLLNSSASSTLSLSKNGVQIATTGSTDLRVPVPTTSAAYAFQEDVDLSATSWAGLSTHTHTVLGFNSDSTSNGAYVPVLTADYGATVSSSNGLSVANGKVAPLTVTIAHQSGGNPGTINAFSAQTSTDDGQTWHAATVAGGAGGIYTVDPGQLPSSGYLSLSISAGDSAGASLQQQITRAYLLTPATIGVISNPVSPCTPSGWSVQQNLQVGNFPWSDRPYTMTSIPAALLGSQWIKPPMACKTATNNPEVTFNISAAMTINVALDARVSPKPTWLTGWTDTKTQILDSESTPSHLEVYSKAFPAGSVALGPNAGSGSSYVQYLVIGSGGGGPTPPSAPTNLLATPGKGSVGLSWSPPTSNGGASITS
ncbi:MAG TPA: S8 family serine peptidase, partial [Candidatus Dormibacteraeota bacterium]|nr:S8 family serine peptidase [Candidatus Dormibacteraeota bacterium]